VYDRESKQFSSLPGANDPALVQSNPTWSPDGRWVVFTRTRAVPLKSAKFKGRLMLSREENDELFAQTKEYRYDLYRVPFNGGQGGKAEPVRGASGNGRSNYFPKFSPDGRWIVFCQASNYMLLQPDSALFIIPAEGGEARRLGCNLARMNSWHSWSPDGRWLVFSSKSHSDYTQLYLARIDEQGRASPPVWLAHMVESGRAANIPEFVDLPAGAIAKIREQFVDDASFVRAGYPFLNAGDLDGALARFKAALAMNPDNATAHQMLGLLLGQSDKKQALEHLEAAMHLKPHDPITLYAFGCSEAGRGALSNAVECFEEAVRSLPNGDDKQYGVFDRKHRLPELLRYKLGMAYEQSGQAAKAEREYRAALGLAPDYPEAHQNLGVLLMRSGQITEAEDHFSRAVQLMPGFAQAYSCLGIIRQQQNRKPEALACFQKAVQCDPGEWRTRLNLAFAYLSDGSQDEAIAELQEVLRIQPGCEPARQALAKLQSPVK
jgi:tetratricopeptide (TPR) repeat protein